MIVRTAESRGSGGNGFSCSGDDGTAFVLSSKKRKGDDDIIYIAEEESRDIATALELSRNVTTEIKMTVIDTNEPVVINRSNLNAIIESLASSYKIEISNCTFMICVVCNSSFSCEIQLEIL